MTGTNRVTRGRSRRPSRKRGASNLGIENIDTNIFFKIKTGKRTRGYDFTSVKGQSRLDVRKYSFSQRTVNEWNKLSADCVHSSSVNMFKNRIGNCLVRTGFTYSVDSYMYVDSR